MAVLDVTNLRYYYRTRRGAVKAVDDISFSIDAGTTLALVGESGCGKTSTATAILRLLPRNVDTYEGQILLDGQDVKAFSNEEFRKNVRWRGISMVFQGAMNALSPTTRCGMQIAEPLIVHYDSTAEEALSAAKEELKKVGLPDYVADRYPHELSGGMKQRVVIAMALVMKPRLVILDEPTSALDVMTQANIINLLKALQKETGLAYLFITHDLGLASELASDVAIMYAGRIVEIGSASKVYSSPQHPYTQKLIHSVPRLRSEEAPEFIPGAPPDLTQAPLGCRFHPRCPFAFEPCGWSSSELAAILAREAPGLELEDVYLTNVAKYDTKDPWRLVVTPTKESPASAIVRTIQELVDTRRSSATFLRAIEKVEERDGRVVVKLHHGEVPELAGEDGQRAACWLLRKEAQPVAAG